MTPTTEGLMPCFACGGKMTNQFAERGADEWACTNPDCYCWPMTWQQLQTAYCWKRIKELEKENSKLKSVVIACSEDPMPEWSKNVWDLNMRIKELEAKLETARKENSVNG